MDALRLALYAMVNYICTDGVAYILDVSTWI